MIRLLRENPHKSLELSNKTNWKIFALNAGLNLMLLYLTNKYIITFPVFQNSLQDQLNPDQLNTYFLEKEHLAFLGYLALVLYLLVKYAVISLILQLGSDFMGFKIPFHILFRAVMVAELIFLFPQAIRITHFISLSGYSINDINTFEPFSLAALITPQNPGPWQFSLQTLNLWELIYWLLLADSIHYFTRRTIYESFKLLLVTYIPSLIFWLITVAFLLFSVSR